MRTAAVRAGRTDRRPPPRLRNALIPVVTITASSWATSRRHGDRREIFALPGIGRLVFNAISQRDYALVQGIAYSSL